MVGQCDHMLSLIAERSVCCGRRKLQRLTVKLSRWSLGQRNVTIATPAVYQIFPLEQSCGYNILSRNAGRILVKSSKNAMEAAAFWCDPKLGEFTGVTGDFWSCIHHPRVLASFDPGKPLRLETDAAQSRGLGMALWLQDSDGSWRLLQCGSRSVTSAESCYSATEIELLAVVWAIKKANTFLAGTPFELIVDHRPLVAIINSKSLDQITSPRLIRLKEKLSP